jgi:hypothetical protein
MNGFLGMTFPRCYLRHPLHIVKWINPFCNAFCCCAIEAIVAVQI